jgi:NADH-quinone oxidoreductase subunit M
MNLLPILVLLPLIGGLLICASYGRLGVWAHRLSVALATAVFFGGVLLTRQVAEAPLSGPGDGMVHPHVSYAPEWMTLSLPIEIQGHPVHWQLQLGADAFAASMVLLAGLVTLAVLLTAPRQISQRLGLYSGLILIVQGWLVGVFLAMDLLIFYVCFEAVLLPLILLINLWGDPKEAMRASRKFLLFTLAGSIPMVVGLVGLVLQSATPERPSTVLLSELSGNEYRMRLAPIIEPAASAEDKDAKLAAQQAQVSAITRSQWIILLTLALGLGIKMALLPLHSWLPATYAAAHPNTTALIAAVVGKLGVYGLLRLVLPLTPVALSETLQWTIAALGAIAIVYGAVIALGQTDLRKIFAYSSLSHMGFVTLGLMAMNREGLSGATLQMFNHGLLTAAMFLLLGMIESRRGRLTLDEQSHGLAAAYPRLGTLLVFFTLAGAGLPGLNGFVGELLALTGMTRLSIPLVAVAVLGTVLGAWYGLRVVQFILCGSDGSAKHPADSSDLRTADLVALVPLAVLALAIGVMPSRATNFLRDDVEHLASRLEPLNHLVHPQADASMLVKRGE